MCVCKYVCVEVRFCFFVIDFLFMIIICFVFRSQYVNGLSELSEEVRKELFQTTGKGEREKEGERKGGGRGKGEVSNLIRDNYANIRVFFF